LVVSDQIIYIDARRERAIELVKSLPGVVGFGCEREDLARCLCTGLDCQPFSIWSALGKRFDNIVVLTEDGYDRERNDVVKQLQCRLSGPDGKVFVVA
jgi:hypothetical protein